MKKQLLAWHNKLMWFGLAAIVGWAVSGISHPLMAWFGPQSVKMFPPRLQLDQRDVMTVENIIRKHKLHEAVIAKLVPTASGAMLQVTFQQDIDHSPQSTPYNTPYSSPFNTEPLVTAQTKESSSLQRRYFSLRTGVEMLDFDQQQALWLAAYYTGLGINQVSAVRKITQFSHEYPRINRLLPVYRVDIGSETDAVSAYVYTETNALATINNPAKQKLQSVFQVLHTWSWLDFAGLGRVLLLALLLLTLLAMSVTGLLLVINLSQRKMKDGSRRWHRNLGYIMWLPLMAWVASGFYHLLQAHYVEPVSGLRVGQTVNLQEWLTKTGSEATWQQNFSTSLSDDRPLNAISLVSNGDKNYYRLSVAPDSKKVTRTARFDGQPSEKKVVYIDSLTGLPSLHSDQDQAESLIGQLLSPNTQYSGIKRITHFGPDYDFRNKRLPVWQIDIADDKGTRIFVDPITGILVDQNRRIDRLEALSFSLLHKWNHLVPLTGRQWRDVAIVTTLVMSLVLAGLGLQVYIRRRIKRTKRSKTSQQPIPEIAQAASDGVSI